MNLKSSKVVVERSASTAISILALILAGASLWFTTFYENPKLKVLIVGFGIDANVLECEERSGLCLNADLDVEVVLINDGNKPATLVGAYFHFPETTKGGQYPFCWNGAGLLTGVLGNALVVPDSTTHRFAMAVTHQVDVNDRDYFSVDGGSIQAMHSTLKDFPICLVFEGLDHEGNHGKAIVHVGTIAIESDDGDHLVHWSVQQDPIAIVFPE